MSEPNTTAEAELATAAQKITDLGAALATAKTEADGFKAERDTAITERDAAKSALASEQEAHTKTKEDLTAAESLASDEAAKVAALTTERDKLKADLDAEKAKERDFNASVATEAAKIAAKQSGAPLSVAPGATDAPEVKPGATREEAYAAMAKITDPDKQRAFYESHIRGKF